MQHSKIELWDNTVEGDLQPYMESYLLDNKQAGAVLVCPGGGYARRADHEGGVIAQKFNEFGFHAFVVHYRVAPNRHPAPLKDISRAVRLVRQNAENWQINNNQIAVCGFSAGGHLTGSIGVHYADPDTLNNDSLDAISARPDALILCYAVLSAGEHRHQGSYDNLLGQEASEEMMAKMSLEEQVDADTPPTFLWHTADDGAVPVENSLLFANALSKNKVPFELHVFPKGTHGLGLAADLPDVSAWSNLAGVWLNGLWP